MAEEPDVQSAEITLDDFNADEQDTSKTEPSPVKEAKAEKQPEAKDEEVKAEEPAAESTETTETEDPKVEETETEDKPQTKAENQVAEKRKAELNSEIRDLVSQRNALKTEVEKTNAEVYQVATEDELVAEGLSATDAKVESLRQRMEVKDYNDRVVDAQLTLSSESERVLNDFPIFNPDSDQFDKELAQEASELLSANLLIDPNTKQVIGSNVSPYQLYKTLARASGISAVKGQIKAQEATEKQLANADANSSAAPPQKTKDPLMELWAED